MNKPLGIRTTYRGVTFRSRTEACWGCFFDLVNWRWEYEPIDLAGYIPDFVISFDARPLLVEVKPDLEVTSLRTYAGKIERSGWADEALILLAAPIDAETGSPVLGLFGERAGEEWQWSPARAFTCISCGNLSVLAEDGSWRCRYCGADDGNAHVGRVDNGLTEWAQAKNRVQWRPGA